MPDPIAFDAVADIYDEYVRVEFDIPFWLSEARAVNAKVLELTCGTGRVSLPLLRAGVDLTCVDYAPEMLARFRTKLEAHHLSCTLVRQDIAELDLPDRFALIFIPFHSFSEILREERRRDALARIREHLAPRGVFICALQNPVVRTASMDGEMRTVGEFPLANQDRLIVSSGLIYDPATQLAAGRQTYERVSAGGKLLDHRTLDIHFYLFRREEFAKLAEAAGFEVLELYGAYDRSPFDEQSSPFMIWKLRALPTAT